MSAPHDPRVRALARELPSYAPEVARRLGCAESDLGPLGAAHCAALREVLTLLGPLEARFRTGYDADELEAALATLPRDVGGTTSM